MIPLLWHYIEKPGKVSIKSSESVIQATFITIQWTAPADDGGSPITGYRMILQKGETEIEKDDITDPGTTTYPFRGLEKNTNLVHSETVFQKFRIRGRSYCKDD